VSKPRRVVPLLPVIARDRLVNDLIDPLPRVVKLVAPAGYGKSTLARAVSERTGATALVDLTYVQTAIDASRTFVEALSARVEPTRREIIAEQSVMCGSDTGAWQSLVLECLRSSDSDVLVLENAESVAGNDAVLRLIERWLGRAPERLNVFICARVDVGLRLGRFAGPDRTRVIGADELRFDRDDIALLFANVQLKRGELEAIERFTRGWPIVALMLYTIARRGRLATYLSEDHDVADLYGYLASEVYRFLDRDQQTVLEAAAAIPEVRESDLAAFFGNAEFIASLEALDQDTPFLARGEGGKIDVHPAMRQMLAQRTNHDQILAQLYAKLDRSDGGVRAAQIAFHRNRPDDAATAVVEGVGPFGLTVPSPEVNQILSALPEAIFYKYPTLWSAAALTRATLDVVGWIEAGERLFEAFTAATPPDIRLGVFSVLAQGYVNRGRFADAEVLIDRLREANGDLPLVQMVLGFWGTVLRAYRGEAVEIEAFQRDNAPLLAAVGWRALCEYDVIARIHRIHGNRTEERATLERSVEIARSSGIPIIIAACLNDAAFGAWLWGEDALFEQKVAQLDEVLNPVIRGGFAHFLGCIRGRGLVTPVASEKLKTRAYSYLIAATLAKSDGERRNLAGQAVVAADQSSQRYFQVLTRIGLAFADVPGRDAHLSEAERIAAETASEELQHAVHAIRRGDAAGTMFEALARRFGAAATRTPARVLVDVAAGTVAIDGLREPLRPREAALVGFLAIAGRPVRRDEIVRALWPSHDHDAAAATFKTYVSRLRRIAGDPKFIVLEAARYRLGAPATISGNDGGAVPADNWPWLARALRSH